MYRLTIYSPQNFTFLDFGTKEAADSQVLSILQSNKPFVTINYAAEGTAHIAIAHINKITVERLQDEQRQTNTTGRPATAGAKRAAGTGTRKNAHKGH